MRERRNRQGEEDCGMAEEQHPEGVSPQELQLKLRGVLLEEQKTEYTGSADEKSQENGVFNSQAGCLSHVGEGTTLLNLDAV